MIITMARKNYSMEFRWVTRYNTRRRHSWCGYLSPNTYEACRAATLAVAA